MLYLSPPFHYVLNLEFYFTPSFHYVLPGILPYPIISLCFTWNFTQLFAGRDGRSTHSHPVKREEIRTKRELQSIFNIPQKLPIKRPTATDTPSTPKIRSIIIDPAPAAASKPPTTPPREEDSDMLELHASPEGKNTFSCEFKASMDLKHASTRPTAMQTRRDIPLSLTFNLMAHFSGDEVTFDVVDFKLKQPTLQKDRKPTFGMMLLPPRSNTTKLISPLPATAMQKKRQKMEE